MTKRIDAVDALRGFALAGIVFAHMIEQFIAAPRPAEGWVEPILIDKFASGFHFLLVMGKFFSIFALLFGMSFAIMMGNATQRGNSFSGRFLWRLTILFAFGFVHALIYRGDILTIYVAIGFCLPLFYKVPSKWLGVIAISLFLGLGRYLFFWISGEASLLDYELTPTSPVVIAYIEILKTGSFLDVAWENLRYGFASKFDFQLGIFGRGYLTLAYFLVGMWLVRVGVIGNLPDYKVQIRKVLFWSLGLMVLFYAGMIGAFSQLPQPINFASWPAAAALTLYDLANTSATALLISGFLLLYLRWPESWLKSLAPYGRMALSNYILQSLIGTFIFYGWGLGLLGVIHDWQSFLLSFTIIFIQIRLSTWWLSRYQYGPLEWLWRCGTYFKRVNFRK